MVMDKTRPVKARNQTASNKRSGSWRVQS